MSRYSNICILSPGNMPRYSNICILSPGIFENNLVLLNLWFERMLDSRLPDVFPCTEDKEGLKFYKV